MAVCVRLNEASAAAPLGLALLTNPLLVAGKDLFGAEPFDPFTCGAADFPPDIQSKLDEMQVSRGLSVGPPPTAAGLLTLVRDDWQAPWRAVSQQIDLNWSVKQVQIITAVWYID